MRKDKSITRARFFYLLVLSTLLCFFISPVNGFSQKKYPALLWKISGKGLSKPSYLYGTMHVSSKLAYHLSDQFYEAIQSVDVVGLESDPSKWMQEMDKYNMLDYFSGRQAYGAGYGNFYETAFQLKLPENKLYQSMLAFEPEIINSLLFRNNQQQVNFEESTYIDLFIYQAGAKWDKKIVSLEDFKTSVILGKLASLPDVDKKEETDEDYRGYGAYSSYELLENAYRNADLDAIDSLNEVESISENHKKFLLYDRNIIFAGTIDSILRTQTLFAGVGAAHLPGAKGLIELLRKMGYSVEPVLTKKNDKSSKIKDKLEQMFKPVTLSRHYAPDSLFSYAAPGKLVSILNDNYVNFNLYADMTNGAYYSIGRIKTFAMLKELDQKKIKQKLDSMLYEYIPGKILSKTEINNESGCIGFDIFNETRKGDVQRYHIYITDQEVIIFKLGGKSAYAKTKDAKEFFNSITFARQKKNYQRFQPKTGGFEVNLPVNAQYEKKQLAANKSLVEFVTASDKEKNIFYAVLHAVYSDMNYIEEDTFELNVISKNILKDFKLTENNHFQSVREGNYPTMTFSGESKKKDQKLFGKIYLNGVHYYVQYAFGNMQMSIPESFFSSFHILPFNYIYKKEEITDPNMHFMATDETSNLFDESIDKEVNSRYNEMLKHKKVKDPDYSYDKDEREKNYYSYSSSERIKIDYTKYNDYDFIPENDFWKKQLKNILFNTSLKVSRKQQSSEKNTRTLELLLTDTASSRGIQYKGILKDGILFELYAPLDTIMGMQGWLKDFYASFKPKDTVLSKPIFENKIQLLLTDLMSKDSTIKSRAENSLENLAFCKEYSDAIIAFITDTLINHVSSDARAQLFVNAGTMKSNNIIEPYKKLYNLYQDSSYLQLNLIKGLSLLKTKESYAAIRELLLYEPPIIGDEHAVQNVFDVFYDSLELCKLFYPKWMSLSRFQEYKKPVINLMAALVKEKILTNADYESLKQDILIEANYELKRYNAGRNETGRNEDNYDYDYKDYGLNSSASISNVASMTYSTANDDFMSFIILLSPFYKNDEGVKKFFTKLKASKNEELQLLIQTEQLKNGHSINDSILRAYAKNTKTTFLLYHRLKEIKQLQYFPKDYYTQSYFCEVFLQDKISNKHGGYGDRKDKQPEKLSYYKSIATKNKREKGKIYIFKREENKNKEERWACVFVPDKTEITVDLSLIDLSLVVPKSKTEAECLNELVEDFSLRYRKRARPGYDYRSGDD